MADTDTPVANRMHICGVSVSCPYSRSARIPCALTAHTLAESLTVSRQKPRKATKMITIDYTSGPNNHNQ